MTGKTLFTLLAVLLFQVSVVLEAKQTSTKEGVDIFPIAYLLTMAPISAYQFMSTYFRIR